MSVERVMGSSGEDKLRLALFALFSIITFLNPAFLSCSSTASVTPTTVTADANEPQRIFYVMQPATLGSRSIVDYSQFLNPGEEVSGYMMVLGLWEVEGDFTTPWTFEAWNPDGVLLDTATFNWDNDPYHPFQFTATTAGEYIIRAIHVSLYTRDLNIEINPTGWKLKEARTS